jgi:predicted dinucleotide-binding enzyme
LVALVGGSHLARGVERAEEAAHDAVKITQVCRSQRVDHVVTHGPVGEPITSAIVILALPHAAVGDVLNQYAGGTVGAESTTVLIAGDDADAEAALATIIKQAGCVPWTPDRSNEPGAKPSGFS